MTNSNDDLTVEQELNIAAFDTNTRMQCLTLAATIGAKTADEVLDAAEQFYAFAVTSYGDEDDFEEVADPDPEDDFADCDCGMLYAHDPVDFPDTPVGELDYTAALRQLMADRADELCAKLDEDTRRGPLDAWIEKSKAEYAAAQASVQAEEDKNVGNIARLVGPGIYFVDDEGNVNACVPMGGDAIMVSDDVADKLAQNYIERNFKAAFKDVFGG